MANILVRNLDANAVKRLKARAKLNGRSLQSEAKMVLESAATYSPVEAREVARRWRTALSSRRMDDSTKLIREDRRR